MVLQVPKFRRGHAHVRIIRSAQVVEDANQLIRFREREWPKQNAVDDAEGRNVGADAERECDHRNEQEAGALEQDAERVSQVLDE